MIERPEVTALSAEEIAELERLLRKASALDPSSAAYLAIERAAASLAKTAKQKRRLARKRAGRAHDVALLTSEAASEEDDTRQLHRARACYACKAPYRSVSTSYPLLCGACASRSATARDRPLDVRGRRALVTGGRVKIGYAIALRLLRGGAETHVTSRFPRAAREVYAREPDAADWSSRLFIHGADFRDLGRLGELLATWKEGPPFDIVINNAAQSVWRPPAELARLHAGEASAGEHVDEGLGSLLAPLTKRFRDLDTAREDSWVQKLGEVSALALVEAQVVNAIAPYLVCSELRENLRRSPHPDRYIVNVTAVEGQFAREDKTTRHPHNNMAKASLNMLTRTSADDLATDGIYLVAVDPGWVSREGQWVHAAGGQPVLPLPLTPEDGAARVLHPIAEGLGGRPSYGVLLKDFLVVPW